MTATTMDDPATKEAVISLGWWTLACGILPAVSVLIKGVFGFKTNLKREWPLIVTTAVHGTFIPMSFYACFQPARLWNLLGTLGLDEHHIFLKATAPAAIVALGVYALMRHIDSHGPATKATGRTGPPRRPQPPRRSATWRDSIHDLPKLPWPLDVKVGLPQLKEREGPLTMTLSACLVAWAYAGGLLWQAQWSIV